MSVTIDSIFDVPNWKEQQPHYASLMEPLQDDCFGNLIIIKDHTAHSRAISFTHDYDFWSYYLWY